MDEMVTRVGCRRAKRFEVSGISELVDIDDMPTAFVDEQPDQCRADESGTAGDEEDFRGIHHLRRHDPIFAGSFGKIHGGIGADDGIFWSFFVTEFSDTATEGDEHFVVFVQEEFFC